MNATTGEKLVLFAVRQRCKFEPADWLSDAHETTNLERATVAEFPALISFGRERPAPGWSGRRAELLMVATMLDPDDRGLKKRIEDTGFRPSDFANRLDLQAWI